MNYYFKIFVALMALLVFFGKGHAAQQTEVIVIASIHGAHKNHSGYDYETLFSLVQSFKPEFVGVEIRADDINSDVSYLRSNYPSEMIELSQRYKGRVFGFDWLGYEIENQSIPSDYWKNLRVLQLSKELDADTEMLNRQPNKLNELAKLQEEIVQSATPALLNNGKYGKICREIDGLEENWLKNTPYTEIQKFNQTRDAEIGKNIITFIENNKGKRIALILGADHRTFAVENITKHFGEQVLITPIKNLLETAG